MGPADNEREPGYAELHAISNFTFLRGASHPEELVEHAHALGYRALALTDECSLAGVVRAHVAAKQLGLPLIVGSEITMEQGQRLVLLATDIEGYGNLSALITRGRRRAVKGEYHLSKDDLAGATSGCLALLIPDDRGLRPQRCGLDTLSRQVRWVSDVFAGNTWLAVELLCSGNDRARLEQLTTIAHRCGLPLVAAGAVHMHCRQRKSVQDALTAIRLGTTVQTAGLALHANAERHLRSRRRLRRIYPPQLLEETLAIAERCRFSLDELRYRYPGELTPPGVSASEHLRALTEVGMTQRWPDGPPQTVKDLVAHELALIAELGYEAYFLTVHDIVHFARSRGILCQGRGSAANSAVCFCLGITEVDPSRMDLLFERFVSRERHEPPDIDVDFEHERREEVIQYVYRKYGRDRAALTATVISYRPRSALRDVGKALGLSLEQVDRLAKNVSWWDGAAVVPERVREIGLDPANPLIDRILKLVNTIVGFPRHLSQHVGGFVISAQPLSRLVPIENAAMAERTVIQWDKDDIDALGLLKVDCLGLGMLSAIRRAFDLVETHRGKRLTLASVPAEDPAVYSMIQRADTIGVFQIESRAQMAMLPRLRPANFYDLVVEVAIVRPGPIQGEMVHPYLRRRQGQEPVTYPSAAVRRVLERTLGIPIFQEQVIKLAMVAAGFTPGEADGLRRSMAAWRRRGGLQHYAQRLIHGMRERGYSEDFARRIFQQIQGFGEYGFPESHAASFALLVYVSAWLKCHEPAAFTCALLNSQPMGFYAPAQLVRDARRQGVEIRPVDAMLSNWDCSLENDSEQRRGGGTSDPKQGGHPALRLGLRLVKGLGQAAASRITAARTQTPFYSVADLGRRAGLNRAELTALAAAGALTRLGGHRHRAHWAAAGVEPPLTLLGAAEVREATPMLRRPTEAEEIVADYASLGLTLGRHPLALLRDKLGDLGVHAAKTIHHLEHGARTHAAGIVVTRQHPASANNVIFVTLEDETGHVNAIVWKSIAERYRRALMGAQLMSIVGEVQREGEVLHVIATRIDDYSALIDLLTVQSRDFR